ncbi:MAG: hypothetical protein LBB23_03065 [Rickettsiales bacterium]|jgi:hypothetical protein|nr:hypothetical protein [Rickettsiales bacterium]
MNKPPKNYWENRTQLKAVRIVKIIQEIYSMSKSVVDERAGLKSLDPETQHIFLNYPSNNDIFQNALGLCANGTKDAKCLSHIMDEDIKFENAILKMGKAGIIGIQIKIKPVILRDVCYEIVRVGADGIVAKNAYDYEIRMHNACLDEQIESTQEDIEDLENYPRRRRNGELNFNKNKIKKLHSDTYRLYFETLIRDTCADLPELHNDDRRNLMAMVGQQKIK